MIEHESGRRNGERAERGGERERGRGRERGSDIGGCRDSSDLNGNRTKRISEISCFQNSDQQKIKKQIIVHLTLDLEAASLSGSSSS